MPRLHMYVKVVYGLRFFGPSGAFAASLEFGGLGFSLAPTAFTFGNGVTIAAPNSMVVQCQTSSPIISP